MEITLQNYIVQLLETWALMIVDIADGVQIFEQDESLYIASLDFKGTVSGTYEIVCQKGFGEILVQNLLGDDNQPDDSQIFDALKEMVNVMSGNLLTTSYGHDTVFELKSPEARFGTKNELDAVSKHTVFYFIAEDNPVAVSFYLDAAQ